LAGESLLLLFFKQEFRVTDDVDEQNMPDFQGQIGLSLIRHKPNGALVARKNGAGSSQISGIESLDQFLEPWIIAQGVKTCVRFDAAKGPLQKNFALVKAFFEQPQRLFFFAQG
jgi:hypothetical protein